jgi:dTDP-4-dehydrorhamnose reductase
MGNKRVFITGGSGVLGKSLIENFPKEYSIFAPSSTECNIVDLERTTNTIQKYAPEILIHAAAYVDTFGCEEDLEKALTSNIEGTLNIVKASMSLSCKVVYISSEYVFGGSKGNYTINDRLDPKNIYGKTKAASEYIISTLNNHQIIRAPFVSRVYPKVFTDQYCSRFFLEEAVGRIINNILHNTEPLIHIATERASLHQLYLQKGIQAEPITMSKHYTEVIPHDTSLINSSL